MRPTEPRQSAYHVEVAFNGLILALMALLPALEIITRATMDRGISGAALVLQHLTLWIAGAGAALAAAKGELLALSTASFLPRKLAAPVKLFVQTVASVASVGLVVSSAVLVQAEREGGNVLAFGVPMWVALLVLPASFVVIALRLVWTAAPDIRGRVLSAALVLLSVGAGLVFPHLVPSLKWALVALLLVATVLGMPIFASLGGLALVLFVASETPAASVAVEAYRLATSPMYPAIPLFTLAGYILSAGGSSTRLVRLFQAWFGAMRGGPAVVTALAFAFFTAITGASGVTILSLGGLLMPVLLRNRYPERFSLGLLTTSGSIGALFPPSLPVILYAISAGVAVERLFLACLVPGVILVAAVAGYGVIQGHRVEATRTPFNWTEARASLWEARYVVLLPVVVLAGVFGGITTLVEAASVTVLYALLVEGALHRDRGFWSRLPEAVADCARLIGGVLLILAMALGFTNYMVDAEVPTHALHWLREHLHSRVAFLLALNLVLVVVGAAMDIYSGILVMVPLIAPLAEAFGVDPTHLGVIFLVNLQLGYLVPPVGENLFLASYRFHRPIVEVFRATAPFVVIIAIVTLLVTYVPQLTLGPLQLLGR